MICLQQDLYTSSSVNRRSVGCSLAEWHNSRQSSYLSRSVFVTTACPMSLLTGRPGALDKTMRHWGSAICNIASCIIACESLTWPETVHVAAAKIDPGHGLFAHSIKLCSLLVTQLACCAALVHSVNAGSPHTEPACISWLVTLCDQANWRPPI